MLELKDIVQISQITNTEKLEDFEIVIGIYDHEVLTQNIKKLDLIYNQILGS